MRADFIYLHNNMQILCAVHIDKEAALQVNIVGAPEVTSVLMRGQDGALPRPSGCRKLLTVVVLNTVSLGTYVI